MSTKEFKLLLLLPPLWWEPPGTLRRGTSVVLVPNPTGAWFVCRSNCLRRPPTSSNACDADVAVVTVEKEEEEEEEGGDLLRWGGQLSSNRSVPPSYRPPDERLEALLGWTPMGFRGFNGGVLEGGVEEALFLLRPPCLTPCRL
jgi:hypothetical protein